MACKVTREASPIRGIEVACAADRADFVSFSPYGDRIALTVREGSRSSQIILTKEDVKELASALAEWANS